MVWQLDIRLYRNLNIHANTHCTQSRNNDVVNMNNLRIKDNNNLLNLIVMKWALMWNVIIVGSAIYFNVFFLRWVEQGWQTCYLLVQMAIYNENSYLGHIFQDVGNNLWHLKTLDSSTLEPCRLTTPRTEDNSASYCNCRFSNIDGDKEQNLRTAALNIIFIF